ncbi:MAG: hypothetical protein K0B10_15045 [Vicingaceae bacterium]|nr:hypothetical protein [Vicingaceae bacterium]
MKKIIFILAAIVISITGCEKEEKDTSFVLMGRILKDCSGEPLANFPLEAIVSTRRIIHATDYYYFDTDANGNINLLIDEFGGVKLRAAAGATLLSGIVPAENQKELNLGTFMASPTTSFVYRIKVNNPYNVGDTLVTDLKGLGIAGRFKFAAPLQDTSFEVTNYSVLSPQSFSTIGFIPVEIGYGVFKNDILIPHRNPKNRG